MAVLAALSKSCLANDLSKIFESDCIKFTSQQLDSKCPSDPISIVTIRRLPFPGNLNHSIVSGKGVSVSFCSVHCVIHIDV